MVADGDARADDLAALTDAEARLAAALVELERHPGHLMLAAGAYTGITAERWSQASATLAALWGDFATFRGALDEARARPAERHRLVRAVSVETCDGASITLDALACRMDAALREVSDVVTTCDATHRAVFTALAIAMVGARAVFADIDPTRLTVDPEQIAPLIGPKTRAIVPVHLYGQPADMSGIERIAARHGLAIVEDCCQAHLATAEGRPVGTIGVAGAFSFYPTKNLGALGDGGAIVTRDAALADRIRRLRNGGQRGRYDHDEFGVNSRLDEIQAAVLRARLPHLSFDRDVGGRTRHNRAHWKLEAIDTYAGARPLAWIDDAHDDACRAWALARPAPTLLVATEPPELEAYRRQAVARFGPRDLPSRNARSRSRSTSFSSRCTALVTRKPMLAVMPILSSLIAIGLSRTRSSRSARASNSARLAGCVPRITPN